MTVSPSQVSAGFGEGCVQQRAILENVDVPAHRLEERDDALPRVVLAADGFGTAREQAVGAELGGGYEQNLARLEVMLNESDRHSCALRDVAQSHALETALRKDGGDGAEDALALDIGFAHGTDGSNG